MGNRFIISFLSIICFANTASLAQNFSATEYDKALWMTTRFYGAQRSGNNNWLLHNHLPSGVAEKYRGTAFIEDKDTDGYDLSGGWHDCGDHVKFGQTEFYSAYMLLKGFAEFPKGYDDYYSYEYKGYANSGKWNWEDNTHDPNGIPDILDEVKHATDYFIKCTRNSTTFYYQVGQGGPDHQKWVTATMMQTLPKNEGGQVRIVYKNPSDASMPSFAGATLALMSRMYRKYDPAYADLCLQHAKYAYAYAKAHPGTAATGDGGFYDKNDNWKDDYATMCAELFWATGTTSYKNEALAFSISASAGQAEIYGKADWVDYSNNGEIAIYNLALLGKTNAKTVFNQCISNILAKTQADGQFSGGNASWGPLRYNANTAFHVALWQKLNGTDNTVHKFIYDNIDYILGKNSKNLSYVVGFGSNSAKFPHHRNVFLRDDNPGDVIKRSLTIPAKNKQFGQMVGGTRNPNTYNDDLVSYTHTEGGIDYNACLVGAIAFIKSKLAPVDTNKFGNITPDLGPDQSICGVSSITLDANVPVDNKKTFTWKKDDAVIHTASTTRRTIAVNSAGKYTVVLDSAGEWQTTSVVNILGVLPDVNLGVDKELCKPATAELTTSVSGAGIQYTWKKNNQVIEGANTNSYTAYSVGTYTLEISATGCPTKSDEVVVTSKLPTVTHDTICKAGVANLAVSGAGPYEWYATESSTTVLKTGNTYSPTISSSTIYYVENASSIAATAGPKASSNTLSETQNGGAIGINFTAMKAFTIAELSAHPLIFNCPSDNVSVTFTLEKDGVSQGTYTTNTVTCTGVQTESATSFKTYTLTFDTPVVIDGPGNYVLKPSGGSQLIWYQSGADYNQMDVAGVIDITGDTRNDKPSSFPGIFDLKIQSGSGCDRTPVLAVIDSEADCGPVTSIYDNLGTESFIGVYPNPSAEYFTLKAMNLAGGNEVRVFDDLGRMVEQFNANSTQVFGKNLSTGMYHVIIYQDGKVLKSINVVKK